MFYRQFRVCREDFIYILMRIQPSLVKKTRQVINSSGSKVSPELMLMSTLRILAGASYLNMIHYRVYVDSISGIVWDTVLAIHDRSDNIKLASTDIECLTLAKEWALLENLSIPGWNVDLRNTGSLAKTREMGFRVSINTC